MNCGIKFLLISPIFCDTHFMNENNERCVNRPGRPTKFCEELAIIVVAKVRKNLSISNAARFAAVEPSTVLDWIAKGRAEKEAGKNTDFAQFYNDVREAQAEKVAELMEKIESMPKAWAAIAWLLEKCCAEDFGKDSELYKQLLEDYKMLMQSLIDQNKGANHGSQTSGTETS
jgi:transposase